MNVNIQPFLNWTPQINSSAFIASNAIVIGNVEIGEESSVWFGCVIRGDVHEIRIGKRSNIQDGTIIHVTDGRFGTYIGDGVTVGHSAVLHACTLEDNSFVGMGAILLDGVVVESGAMVAAGAMVPPGKRVKSGELWAGNPAKLLRDLRPQDGAFFPVSAQNYVRLSRQYMPIK